MSVKTVGVVGAGTMGAGIAQLACLGGFETHIHDPVPEALTAGAERLRAALDKGAARDLWSKADAADAARRLQIAASEDDLASCELVIEAAPEDLDLKQALFARLASTCGPDAILATNTSSLSVTAIAEETERRERVCGMHFFNPPALMRLVEVVAGEATDEATLATAAEVGRAMRREPIRCADSPGFIVNRCNRPFALESLRILDEGVASHEQIDHIMREDGGYPMGPFELMDLIGIDVNLAVARSFYHQRAEPRWRPHAIQERLVSEVRLGRKSGRGFYDYAPGHEERANDVQLPSADVRAVLNRVVSQLVNEASFAVGEGVASPPDIDAAMKLGLNHPRGPFEWVSQIGAAEVVATLDALRERTEDERYAVAPLLRQAADGGGWS